MKKEEVKGSEEEVKIIKSKYKKMRLIILLILLFIVVVYVTSLLITALRVQNVLQNNVAVDLGNNYKFTRTYNGISNATYYKDGICNYVFSDGKYGLYEKDNEIYQVMYETKEYQKINSENFLNISSTVSLLNYVAMDEEYVNSLKDMIVFVYQANVKFDTETINNQKYLVVEMKAFGEKLWVNADTYLVEKENMQGQVTEQKIEKNVVTDEDIKSPWDLGFIEKSEN